MTGYSRNTGINFIMGEYLGFLDYDDIFHKDALRIAYFEAKKKNYTFINFKYKPFENEKSLSDYLNDYKNSYKIEILNKHYNFPIERTGIHIWRNIYKSSFILSYNFKFANTWSDEDVIFCMTVFSFDFEILLINKELVFHRLLKTSVGHNNKKIEIRQDSILYHLRNIFKIFKKYNIKNNRIRENTFFLLEQNHFRSEGVEKLLLFIKGYKDIFSEDIIRKYFIRIFSIKELEKLYLYKKININKYQLIIKIKYKCYI